MLKVPLESCIHKQPRVAATSTLPYEAVRTPPIRNNYTLRAGHVVMETQSSPHTPALYWNIPLSNPLKLVRCTCTVEEKNITHRLPLRLEP